MTSTAGRRPAEVSFAVDKQVVGALASQRSCISFRKEFTLGERTGVLRILWRPNTRIVSCPTCPVPPHKPRPNDSGSVRNPP